MVGAGQEWSNDLIRFGGKGTLFGDEVEFEFFDIGIGRFGELVLGCGRFGWWMGWWMIGCWGLISCLGLGPCRGLDP
jgi:hypothetical protein